MLLLLSAAQTANAHNASNNVTSECSSRKTLASTFYKGSYKLSKDGSRLLKWKGKEENIDMNKDAALKGVKIIERRAFEDNEYVRSLKLSPGVEEIELASMSQLTQLQAPENSQLRKAKLFILNNLSNLELDACSQLQELEIESANAIKQINFIKMKELRKLKLGAMEDTELNNLSACKQLKEVNLWRVSSFENINLSACKAPENITICECNSVKSLTITHCTHLKKVTVGYSSDIKIINLTGCKALTDLWLSSCNSLRKVVLMGCSHLKSNFRESLSPQTVVIAPNGQKI